MAVEHTNNKVPEFEGNVGDEGAVETKERGMFDFLGKKEEVEKPQEGVMITTEFEKVKIEEEEEQVHKEDHEKKHTLLEKLHRSDSSSSSSSDEEEGEGGEKKKKKKKNKDTTVPVEKCNEPVIVNPETPGKKGFIEKIKEKLPGQHNKAEEITTPPAAPTESVAVAEPHEGETKEKKGFLEKIKEKLPGYHSKTDEEKEKEKEISASH